MRKNRYRNLFDLTGRIAVVTGATGILGRRFCAALCDFGAKVAVVDLDEAQCTTFAAELHARFGVATMGIACDVSREASVKEMSAAVEARLGPVSILHNNAATKTADLKAFFEPTDTYDLDTWREVMSVNLDGYFLVARTIGSRMAERGSGTILQTASIYGCMAPDPRIYRGSDYMGGPINTPAAYSASKAGVVGLTRHLATFWGERGVRVNSISPGGVSSGQNGTFQQKYSARIPLGRMAEADEMTGIVVFLASDASSYITGQNFLVDGGLSVW